MSTDGPRDWEASTYDRVSTPHRAWGADVLGRLSLRGDERALDAGCGTGRVTAELLKLVPDGHVVGVDGSPAMIAQAGRVLPREVELLVQDLTALVLDAPVDVIVSTATFHWIADHDVLFARLAEALVAGGRLEAQCGGAGNIASVVAAIDRLRERSPWGDAFHGWVDDWNFAGPEETETRLRAAGFVDVRAWLEPRPVVLDDAHAFLRTVVLGSYLERLPEEAHDDFVEAVRAELEVDGVVTLDYVRLNLGGTRAADGAAPVALPGEAVPESPEDLATRLRA
ncbi:methyltransferase domain-containing protein [Patulibacter sp.]|uniref:methyltransferase domain-containing protein n=1 Tax=Patulibacter sp. TaxID=1912859 RepID=UPI002725FBEB|nr:methyltransferase domain-containing protein [Patulibacter sp.]MDO9406850.1 methyltransferase domain-containing protein [Patulibacter sp.]